MTSKDGIAKKVTARFIQAMAYNRQAFKDKLEEHLNGALLEFYKAELAEKNGYTKWVKHWRSEVKTLLERSLYTALIHDIRGFTDRKKAFDEVVKIVKGKDRTHRTVAENQVTRDFKVKRLKVKLNDRDTKAFWLSVKKATDPVLKPRY
jgi:hypothetical protein